MNKELIKKYKKEFDHWLNSGQLLHKDEFGNWENSSNIWDLGSERITAVVMNDVFVEFRKAMAEGKIVQQQDYYSKQWIDMKTDNFHVATDTFYEGKYRIKSEEPKFQVGDWITDGIGVWQHKENCRVKNQSSWSLWQPQPGEWCWFWNSNGIPVLEQFSKYHKLNKHKHCEPFIGELPTNLKG